MISSTTPDILQNLKAVLGKIMADGHVKNKYLSALTDVIDEINSSEFVFATDLFALTVKEKEKGGVIIDVFSTQGPLIDSIEYDSDDILTDDDAGQA